MSEWMFLEQLLGFIWGTPRKQILGQEFECNLEVQGFVII